MPVVCPLPTSTAVAGDAAERSPQPNVAELPSFNCTPTSLPSPSSTSARARPPPTIHGSPPRRRPPATTAHEFLPNPTLPTGPSLSSFPAVPLLTPSPHRPRRVVVPSWFPYRTPPIAQPLSEVGSPFFGNSEPIRKSNPPERRRITTTNPVTPVTARHRSQESQRFRPISPVTVLSQLVTGLPPSTSEQGARSRPKTRFIHRRTRAAEAGTPPLATPSNSCRPVPRTSHAPRFHCIR